MSIGDDAVSGSLRNIVLRVYRTLLGDGYHRPNDTIEDLEDALRQLGMSPAEINRVYAEDK